MDALKEIQKQVDRSIENFYSPSLLSKKEANFLRDKPNKTSDEYLILARYASITNLNDFEYEKFIEQSIKMGNKNAEIDLKLHVVTHNPLHTEYKKYKFYLDTANVDDLETEYQKSVLSHHYLNSGRQKEALSIGLTLKSRPPFYFEGLFKIYTSMGNNRLSFINKIKSIKHFISFGIEDTNIYYQGLLEQIKRLNADKIDTIDRKTVSRISSFLSSIPFNDNLIDITLDYL